MTTEISISKKWSFEASHQLEGHQGKCARLHGHSYQLIVGLSGPRQTGGPSDGMVLDYDELDRVVKPLIEAVDHRFIGRGDEPDRPQDSSQIFAIGSRSTAENLSIFFLDYLSRGMTFRLYELGLHAGEYTLTVGVKETEKTEASCSRVLGGGL